MEIIVVLPYADTNIGSLIDRVTAHAKTLDDRAVVCIGAARTEAEGTNLHVVLPRTKVQFAVVEKAFTGLSPASVVKRATTPLQALCQAYYANEPVAVTVDDTQLNGYIAQVHNLTGGFIFLLTQVRDGTLGIEVKPSALESMRGQQSGKRYF